MEKSLSKSKKVLIFLGIALLVALGAYNPAIIESILSPIGDVGNAFGVFFSSLIS